LYLEASKVLGEMAHNEATTNRTGKKAGFYFKLGPGPDPEGINGKVKELVKQLKEGDNPKVSDELNRLYDKYSSKVCLLRCIFAWSYCSMTIA
jgi:hypothetical protein